MPVAATTFCTFTPHALHFCVGNPIMQTRDGSVCTGGLTENSRGRCGWSGVPQQSKPRAAVYLQHRQTAVNNVELSSGRSGVSVCFLVFITAVWGEFTSVTAGCYHNTSLCLCLAPSVFISASFPLVVLIVSFYSSYQSLSFPPLFVLFIDHTENELYWQELNRSIIPIPQKINRFATAALVLKAAARKRSVNSSIILSVTGPWSVNAKLFISSVIMETYSAVATR